VDRLSRKVRRKIGESLRGVRAGPPLESVTTSSLPALRRFSQASRLSALGRYEESVPLYEDAVRLDSNFAMAWRALSISLWNLQHFGGRQGEAIARAYALRNRLTERERYGTEAQYYEWVTADKTRARAAYQALLAINPNDGTALTNLGLLSWFDEDYATAAELAARAIESDSNVKAPYTNLVDAQVSLGQFAAAETTLARWRSRFAADNDYHVQVGFMASARGDYDSAGRAFRRGLSPTGGSAERSRAAGGLASLAIMRGQFAEARRYQRIAPPSGGPFTDVRSALTELGAELHYGLGNNHVVKGLDSLLASSQFKRLELTQRPYTEAAVLYTLAGKPERGRLLFQEGERALLGAGRWGPTVRSSPFRRTLSEAFQAAVLLQSGRPAQAAERFKEAGIGVGLIAWLPEAGMAYERAGAADSALAVYQRYLESTHNYRLMVDRQKLGPVLRRAGDLYLSRGDTARAIDAYHRFVALWRNADPILQAEVTQVQQKLGELAGEPD
jgi:eukaryotic-like serine/threonine-protein kinase